MSMIRASGGLVELKKIYKLFIKINHSLRKGFELKLIMQYFNRYNQQPLD